MEGLPEDEFQFFSSFVLDFHSTCMLAIVVDIASKVVTARETRAGA